MGTASFVQNSFLGGEWSKQMQGRFDRPDYRTGLNLCLNVIPIEEGSAPRRSGTRLGGVTRNGAYGVLREYNVDQAQPYDIELTAGHLRLWRANAGLVTEAGTPIYGVRDEIYFTSLAHGLVDGDQVIFSVGSATSYAGVAQVLGRQMSVIVFDANNFNVVDALTGATIDYALIDFYSYLFTGLMVFKIVDIATPYAEADLQQVRLVQDGVNALLLHPDYAPQTLVISEDSNGLFTDAALAAAATHDGPYLDIPADGSTLTPGATTGSITFTASALTSINGGQGFLASDVGRQFRVFSEPLAWAIATAYVIGNKVKDAGVYWKAVQAGTGIQPSTDAGLYWVIDTTAAAWTWGTIQSVSGASAFVGTLASAVTYPDNVAGGDLLYANPIVAWQLGAYSETTGYPAVGAYYQGRIWLGGAIKNRFDACVSNDFAQNGYINFAPTGKDGTVADNAGIAGTLNAAEIENFLWMLPDEQGILAGTQGGEWVIASSAAGEPITPTSILTRETSHYGSLNAQAVKVGRATVFAHRDGRKVYEYVANYFTQKFVADNLSLKAKHLTKGGVAEIAYMRELTPVIWVRLNDGGLIGCTYKHDDPIQPLEFAGWHQHDLGTGRSVVSIQGGPASGGETDTLSMVTQDAVTGFCYVEFLQTIWGDGDSLLTAWYVDGAAVPAGADRLTVGSTTVIRVYGLWYMVGQTVTAWGAGLDLGDFTVSVDGTIDLPLNAASSLFTDALLASITASGCTNMSVDVASGSDEAIFGYVMSAEENYDPPHVSDIVALTSYANVSINTDQNYQGVQWDPIRRNLMYMYTEDKPSTSLTNDTGFTLWDGLTTIAPDGAVDPASQFNASVGVKNIDTGEVNFHLCYDSTSIVPTGIGGGDGTYRRFTRDFEAAGGNGPGMTDPYTGNFWVNSQSCQLYLFRRQDDYAQVISPLYPVSASDADVMIVGFTNTGATGPWAFAREIFRSTSTGKLYLVPRLLTATEITADYLLIYATFTYPRTADPDLFTAYNREVFDAAGHMYLFSCVPSGGKSFKLYRFALPSSAPYGGPTVGGGFTDITPWGSSGPNADGPSHTLARSRRVDQVQPDSADIIPMYLPATDDLVLIEKFFPSEHTASSFDPAHMFWSCTYVHGPAGTPTYDHHSAFVTGYMGGGWMPTTSTSDGYIVIDAFEVNNYLGQSDYVYGSDYTKRWFFFLCTRMFGGVSDGKPRIVLVEYEFIYGFAPVVVQFIDEEGWDDAYPDYNLSTSAYPPYTTVEAAAVAVSMATSHNPDSYHPLWDVGIHDPTTNSFWWSGGSTAGGIADSTALFCQFNSRFADRMQNVDSLPGAGGTLLGATPPFLKLSFTSETAYCAPFAIGHTFTSRGQILRPVTAQESMTRTGSALGKKRRTTYAAPLLADAQGVSMGVDFLTMRPLAFMSAGGTVPLTLQQTFSGVYWGTVDADSNYDNMWCWEITRPYPCTVVAVEIQHKTNENI